MQKPSNVHPYGYGDLPSDDNIGPRPYDFSGPMTISGNNGTTDAEIPDDHRQSLANEGTFPQLNSQDQEHVTSVPNLSIDPALQSHDNVSSPTLANATSHLNIYRFMAPHNTFLMINVHFQWAILISRAIRLVRARPWRPLK